METQNQVDSEMEQQNQQEILSNEPKVRDEQLGEIAYRLRNSASRQGFQADSLWQIVERIESKHPGLTRGEACRLVLENAAEDMLHYKTSTVIEAASDLDSYEYEEEVREATTNVIEAAAAVLSMLRDMNNVRKAADLLTANNASGTPTR